MGQTRRNRATEVGWQNHQSTTLDHSIDGKQLGQMGRHSMLASVLMPASRTDADVGR